MDYEKWIEENNFEEGFAKWGSFLFKKDGKMAYQDEDGNYYRALSNRLIWEAGYKQCLKDLESVTKAEEIND